MKEFIDTHKTQILISIISICAIGVIICGIVIGVQLRAYAKADAEYSELTDYVVEEPTETDTENSSGKHINTYISEGQVDNTAGISPDHKDYTLPDISINFSALVTQNKDCIGWIYVPTLDKLSYPIVMSHDNDEYVKTSFNGQENKAGCIFCDCRVAAPFVQKTIIYGHNMKNGSMFHGLFEIEKAPEEHPDIWIFLPDGTVNHYVVKETKRCDMLDPDVYSVGSTVNTDVVLSTCVKNNLRLVVILEKDWSY